MGNILAPWGRTRTNTDQHGPSKTKGGSLLYCPCSSVFVSVRLCSSVFRCSAGKELIMLSRRRLAGLGLLLLIAIALALVAIPVWEIRPFVPQTSAGISLAYACHRLAPWVTVLALMAGAALAAGLWRG